MPANTDAAPRLSLSATAARNLATATVTVPQMTEITPRWLHRLLPWVDVDGGVYRVNRIAKAVRGKSANEYGEVKVDLVTVDGGEPKLPSTFVDYEEDPREYHLSTIQTVLHTHTRVTDLYSNKIDQLREQIRLTVEAVKEREEWELINHKDFGLLNEVAAAQRIETRKGAPTPDDLDELLTLVWKKPAFFLAHPKAIIAFGRECTRRGVPPPTVHLFGSPFLTWRGVPLVPSNKLELNGNAGVTSILLLRVGEAEQGVVGLQKTGVTGEVEPGLSVRYMGTNENSIASHLVTRYFSASVLTSDAIARLDNVAVNQYHDYPPPSNFGTTPVAADSPTGESEHNELVARLLAEEFAKLTGRKPQTETLPDKPAGLPAGFKPAGVFPEEGAANVPPVHPSVQPAAPKLAQPQPTTSGGHAPGSSDAHAFGEPRCNGDVLQSKRPASKSANTNPLLGISQPESAATPEFYFLRGGNASGKSPLAAASYPTVAGPIPSFDLDGVRRDFPALHQLVNGRPLIWLDNAATTHKPQAVIDATSRFYSRDNSNIHRAAHTLAARSTELFEAGREKVRQFLGAADAKEIVFVRGTTEAINLVAQSYGRKHIGAGDEIIVTELEHHANIVPWQLLAEQVGATVRVVPINDRGELILEEYAKFLGPRTKFVSVAHVSNSLGTINPVEQIIALAHARGVPVLVDGAQSTPHLPVNVTALDVDFFVFSAHKIFGPTGIGALYGKAPLLEAMPPWQGGGHMIKDVRFEKTVYQNAPEKFEAGTPDIAGVVGLGAAIDYLFKVGIPAIAAYEHALLEYAMQALSTVPGLRPIGTAVNKASVLSFVIPGVSNESIARHLDKQGIAVRAGHHCAQPAQRHFGLESTVRPSLAFYNTREEINQLVHALRLLRRNV